MFSVKDPMPVELRSNVVYKFTCASCNSCYVGETSRHLSTRIREYVNRDRTSHIYQYLQQSVEMEGGLAGMLGRSVRRMRVVELQLRVASCELRVASCELQLRVARYKKKKKRYF